MRQTDDAQEQLTPHQECGGAWVETETERLRQARPVRGGRGVIMLDNDPETERPYRVAGDVPESVTQEND